MRENLKVAIRIRPSIDYDETRRIQVSGNRELRYIHIKRVITNDQTKTLKYDCVSDQFATQEEVFTQFRIKDNVKNLFEGYSSTIFCYGTTGSGKTYTMQGKENTSTKVCHVNKTSLSSMERSSQGVAPRCLESIFRLVEEREARSKDSRLNFKVK